MTFLKIKHFVNSLKPHTFKIISFLFFGLRAVFLYFSILLVLALILIFIIVAFYLTTTNLNLKINFILFLNVIELPNVIHYINHMHINNFPSNFQVIEYLYNDIVFSNTSNSVENAGSNNSDSITVSNFSGSDNATYGGSNSDASASNENYSSNETPVDNVSETSTLVEPDFDSSTLPLDLDSELYLSDDGYDGDTESDNPRPLVICPDCISKYQIELADDNTASTSKSNPTPNFAPTTDTEGSSSSPNPSPKTDTEGSSTSPDSSLSQPTPSAVSPSPNSKTSESNSFN